MSTPLWRKALPEPPAGKANVRIYVKHGYDGNVLEEVVELPEISRDAARDIVALARRKLAPELTRVVHILLEGKSFCAMPGLPRDWPADHFWVSVPDRARATCVKCLQVADAVDK